MGRLLVVYKRVPRNQIADTLLHLRGLFRKFKPANDRESRAQERREIITRNLLSNISRTKEHPTLHTVFEVADAFALTLDGAHRIFGYDLEALREYDSRLNGARTRIIESYSFDRDLSIDLPLQLGSPEAFVKNAMLRELVLNWQTKIPIRALEDKTWRRAGTFYIQVGTEDSLGGGLPPGAIALVEPVSNEELRQPHPKRIYFLQSANGYRCNRCVVARNKLVLIVSGRDNVPNQFVYPEYIRIVGRIRMFALALPVPEYTSLYSLPRSLRKGSLILPWEHASMDRLFAAKHQRFQRTKSELEGVHEVLQEIFHRKVSDRTERRYRHATPSQPHVDVLMQLAISNIARYSDSVGRRRFLLSDMGRFSLDTLLGARHFDDLGDPVMSARPPMPIDRWTELRKEFIEWPLLLSLRLPQLRLQEDQIVRLGETCAIPDVEPEARPGSLLFLNQVAAVPDPNSEMTKTAWSRPIYVFRRGAEIFCGHLQRDGNRYALLWKNKEEVNSVRFSRNELSGLHMVRGIAVPL
jgi:hypothetical protein